MKLISILFIYVVVGFGCSSSPVQTTPVEPVVQEAVESCPSGLKVVGLSMRTTNQNGQAMKDIEALWTRFWKEKIGTRIPEKVNDDIYAVYYDYENGVIGQYTVLVGYLAKSLPKKAKGLTEKELAAGSCKKYVSKGKMPAAILKTWVEIWQDKQLKRAYRTDYTVHGKKYFNGENAEVETYISVY